VWNNCTLVGLPSTQFNWRHTYKRRGAGEKGGGRKKEDVSGPGASAVNKKMKRGKYKRKPENEAWAGGGRKGE